MTSRNIIPQAFAGWFGTEITHIYECEHTPTPDEIREIREYLGQLYGLNARIASIDVIGAESWTDPKARFRVAISLR